MQESRATEPTPEELDALLSARRDGALEAGEAARLEALLETSEAARLRALELERVDAMLRALAAEPIPEARLDRIEAALGRRVAETATRPSAARAPETPIGEKGRRATDDASRERRVSRRRSRGFGLAAALAAGVVLATVVWAPREKNAVVDEPGGQGLPIAGTAGTAEPATREGDELATLGRELGLEDASDLEVIEELELLEFLAARERDAGEPQG
ncbi:MAG: hypothetical protein IPK00_14240 [Deltaproteobacteria bacterium]|nr:hypothetical protein [Deltaproteobacteria bacterium]